MTRASERSLIVEARDLDTDERAIAMFDVDMPIDEASQRAQLAEAVARLHPDAQMRSFGDGAASFLDSQRLVVAHYGAVAEPIRCATSHDHTAHVEQQSLFAV